MAKKIHVGVIFGGRSGEHEVSVRSARAVIEALDREKFDVTPVAITREGKWLSPSSSAAYLPDGARKLLPESVEKSETRLKRSYFEAIELLSVPRGDGRQRHNATTPQRPMNAQLRNAQNAQAKKANSQHEKGRAPNASELPFLSLGVFGIERWTLIGSCGVAELRR